MIKTIESMHRLRLRPIAAAVGLLLLMGSSPAWSLGLGSADVRSRLGEPLRLIVPVRLSGNETLSEECVKSASSNIDDGIPVILGAKVTLQASATSGMSLLVISREPVVEPIVKLVLAAGCGAGVEREYVLLLDPPSPVTIMGDETNAPDKQTQVTASTQKNQHSSPLGAGAAGETVAVPRQSHTAEVAKPLPKPAAPKPRPADRLPSESGTPDKTVSPSQSTSSQPSPGSSATKPATQPKQSRDRLRLDSPQAVPSHAGPGGAVTPAAPGAAPAPEALATSAPSAREEALMAQLTALGSEIQNLKREMAEQSARNQALRDDALPSWLTLLLGGIALAALVAVVMLLLKVKRLQRLAAQETWWSDTKLRADAGRDPLGGSSRNNAGPLTTQVGGQVTDTQQVDVSYPHAGQSAAARGDLELTFPEHLHDARIEVEELGATQAMRVLSKSGAELTAMNPLKTAAAVRTQSIPALDFDLGEIAPVDAPVAVSNSQASSTSPLGDLDVWSRASVENTVRTAASVSADPMPALITEAGSTMSWAQARQAQGYLRQVAEAIEQSDAYLAAGQSESAASVLRRLIQEKEGVPRAPWLMLLHIYRKADKRDAYDGLVQKFAVQFGRPAPTWEAADSAGAELGLDSDPQLLQSIWAKWGSAESMSLLSKLLYEKQVPDESFFNLTLQRDLLNFVKICPLDGA
jgi:hypothetical protein